MKTQFWIGIAYAALQILDWRLKKMIARLTVMGISSVFVVGTVCGLAIYGFIERPDHDLTQQLMAVVLVAAGSLLGGVSKFFSNGNGQ